MKNGLLRILLVDDHAILRAGLKLILGSLPEVDVVLEAGNLQQANEQLRTQRLDLVILDIFLGKQNGLELVETIRTQYPSTRILVLSGRPENEYAHSVLASGVDGFLSKDSASEELLTAIRTVVSGRIYMSPSVAINIARLGAMKGSQRFKAVFSTRELEVLRLIASGKKLSEIGEALGISAKTVTTYRTRILKKAGLASNAELVLFAQRENLLP